MAPDRLPLPDVPGLAAVLAALPEARLVGGVVRDLLAGLPATDIDLATALTPPAVAAALQAAGLPAIPTGLAHGTITTVAQAKTFEITTLRRDVATDGRHASVEFSHDWQQDAGRRDFTINAMSLDRTGVIHDHFGGCEDLVAGRLRFVGDPALRIAEDRLRALRYIRFYARFANLPPDAATLAALTAAAATIGRLSAERIGQEVRRILAAPDPRAALELMRRTGLLAATIGEADFSALGRLLATTAPPDPILRLAAMVRPPEVPRLAAALRLSNAERDRLAAILAAPPPSVQVIPAALADTDATILAARAWLAGCSELAATVLAADTPVFPLRGADLLSAGVPPGPAIGQTLTRARTWWQENGCRADRSTLLAWLYPEAASGTGSPPN